MGTERMGKLLLRMSLPQIAAQLVNLLYNMVDRMYIGHIPQSGPDALAGIGITGSIIMLISAFASFVSGGGAPLAGIALGKGDREEAHKLLGTGTVFLIAVALLTAIPVSIFMDPLLRLIGASETTLPYAHDYLRVYLFGTLFVMLAGGLNAFISLQGRPGLAMVSVILGAGLNLVLDPLFIFTFSLGVKGAAVATVISQGVSACFVVGFLVSDRASLRIMPKFLKLDLRTLRRMLSLGIAPFIMGSTESLIGFVMNGSLSRYGDIYVSTLTIMQSAMQFVSVPLSGFGQGVSPVISYNYGHGDRARVKSAVRILFSIMCSLTFVFYLLMILFPGVVASFFTDDAALIGSVERIMPVFLLGMTIFGMQRACQTVFVAMGQARISLFIALLRKVILLIPLALILPHFMGYMGIYTAEAIADATCATLCMILFVRRFPSMLARCGK
ncbi:MAG: MATE family efflux transporter [Clostridia bacterium]|nr:MATE family efflux transporter [Clostridia bacterium]